MSNSESQTNSNKAALIKQGIALIAGILIAIFVVTYVVNQRLSELQFETKLLISDQETLIATIAETVARNGADEVTEQIIIDCSGAERAEFDRLLGNLNQGLSQSQLRELDRLFGRCGNFFSERKAVMVSRFQREIEIYETFVQQLNNLTDTDNSEEYRVATWQELADMEAKQSTLFAELVDVQDEIITLLINGNSPASDEVTRVLQEATQIQETLIVTQAQAQTLRSTLVSL